MKSDHIGDAETQRRNPTGAQRLRNSRQMWNLESEAFSRAVEASNDLKCPKTSRWANLPRNTGKSSWKNYNVKNVTVNELVSVESGENKESAGFIVNRAERRLSTVSTAASDLEESRNPVVIVNLETELSEFLRQLDSESDSLFQTAAFFSNWLSGCRSRLGEQEF